MKNRITTIAQTAGVSPATVSNALNGRKGVSEETKQKILEIAKDLGFSRELNGKVGKNIKFVIYKKHGYVISDTPFFSSLIEGIERECRNSGYDMLITHINSNDEDYVNIIENINNDSNSGVLLLATEMYPEDLELFNCCEVPVVLLDSHFRNVKHDSVLINNTDASYKATSYLIENGHREIGYLQSSIFINNFHYRKAGYLEAMKENDLCVKEDSILPLEPTLEGSYRDMKQILEECNRTLPTAFFADNDIIAFGAMRAMKEKGIRIPHDVSIIGFDDMPFCEITSPRLTTIKVFKQEMGEAAVKRLLEKMNNSDLTTLKIEVGTELVIRESVRDMNNESK